MTALLGWQATHKLLKEFHFKDKKLKLRLCFKILRGAWRIFKCVQINKFVEKEVNNFLTCMTSPESLWTEKVQLFLSVFETVVCFKYVLIHRKQMFNLLLADRCKHSFLVNIKVTLSFNFLKVEIIYMQI